MFHIQVLTLFPELFDSFRTAGLVSRALEDGHLQLTTTPLRDYAINTHGQVDDTPYGGGSGMILRPESAVAAIEKAKTADPTAKVVLFTPRGKTLTQQLARAIHGECQEGGRGLILLCPRYEGVDERIAEHWVDMELSVGDYILLGGEVPAMALIEAVTRLIPGVLNNPESTLNESFEQPLLEHPQYTKPREFRGHQVPDVLLSGNHQQISEWRRAASWADTVKRRPDLIRAPVKPAGELSLALIHHPVLDKQGDIVTSSITNIDLHDIARSARTYGIEHFYVVHPVRALRKLAQKICDHWSKGYGLTYNPNRSEALATIALVPDFDDVLLDIETRTGSLPQLVSTSARKLGNTTSYSAYRQTLLSDTAPQLIMFGTGWGLGPQIVDRSNVRLEPIVGPSDYNHLSVRAACAIILDRLLGER